MRVQARMIVLSFIFSSILSVSHGLKSPSGNIETIAPQSKLRSSTQQVPTDNRNEIDRRTMMKFMLGVPTVCLALILQPMQPASAYEKSFPIELGYNEGDIDLSQVRQAKMKAKRVKRERGMDFVTQSPLVFRGPKDILTSATWGGAMWLLSGSRSNPLVTPIANILYDENQEKWLKDRNEGLFAPPPLAVLIVLGIVFFALGVAIDRLALLIAEGEANVSLQLAAVTLIGAGSLELGRIASGEKKMTRQEDDRSTQLEGEFAEFAEKRLLPGGNCHRNEVVRSFRRYNPKYRQSNSMEYPLTDVEIERMLKAWNRSRGNPEMSSAGFYSNLQINDKADVFR